jgi:hypothetical protein
MNEIIMMSMCIIQSFHHCLKGPSQNISRNMVSDIEMHVTAAGLVQV